MDFEMGFRGLLADHLTSRLLAIIPARIVAVEVFRYPSTRSLRAVALVVACALAGGIVMGIAPRWTFGDLGELAATVTLGLAGFRIVLAPLRILSVWNGPFSALPPADPS